MKKYIKSDSEVFSEDVFLSTEHALDIACEEAAKASKILRARKDHGPGSVLGEVSEECWKLQKRVRKAREIMYRKYEDTPQSMLEDSSRYLED